MSFVGNFVGNALRRCGASEVAILFPDEVADKVTDKVRYSGREGGKRPQT